MRHPHLIPRRSGKKTYFHFRSFIPKDLIPTFSGRKHFQISLKSVSNKETILVSVLLQTLTEQLFTDIRSGMKKLSLEDVREILKVEVRKSILHSHRVHLGTNKYDPQKIEDSLSSVSSREEKMKQKLKDDLKTYEGMLDEKLNKIFQSLDIEFDTNSINYLQLRTHFIDLYLLRFDFIRSLINETGRTDDDFRREVEENLKLELFPELQEQSTTQIPTVSNPSQVKEQLSTHQSTPLSVNDDEKGHPDLLVK